MVYWMFILLQMALNISDMKFVPTSEIIFFRSLYSVKISFVICIRLSADKLFTFFSIGNLLW